MTACQTLDIKSGSVWPYCSNNNKGQGFGRRDEVYVERIYIEGSYFEMRHLERFQTGWRFCIPQGHRLSRAF